MSEIQNLSKNQLHLKIIYILLYFYLQNKNKKYRTEFKITKIKNKRHHKGRKVKVDIPDIVEAILNESKEMYLEVRNNLHYNHGRYQERALNILQLDKGLFEEHR